NTESYLLRDSHELRKQRFQGAISIPQVMVVDAKNQPLQPVHPGRARLLLSSGKAAVLKRYPFTLVLKVGIAAPQVQPLRLKLDPGSKVTGIALVNDVSGDVVFASELSHRGHG